MRKVALFFMLLISFSCIFEQNNSYYRDYDEILENEFQGKGWLPNEFVLFSINNVYLRNNIDVNTFLIRFSLKKKDFINLTQKLDIMDSIFKKPHGVSIPRWWTTKIDELPKYSYNFNKNGNDKIVSIAIDFSNLTFYCWGRY